MKRTILCLLLFCSPLLASNLNVLWTTTTSSGTTPSRAKQITFIFSTDFTGTIAGACFAGTAGACGSGSPADYSFTLTAPQGDSFAAITYVVTTGTLRIETTAP